MLSVPATKFTGNSEAATHFRNPAVKDRKKVRRQRLPQTLRPIQEQLEVYIDSIWSVGVLVMVRLF